MSLNLVVQIPTVGTSSLGSATLNPGPLTIGATPATAGDIRMSSGGTYIEWLNNAGSGNMIGLGFTTGDILTLGDATNVLGLTANVKTGGTHGLLVNSVACLTVGATYATIGAVASAASAGTVRLGKAFTVKGLNNAGSADITALATDASDQIVIGEATNTAAIVANVKTGGTHTHSVNSVAALTVGATYATIGAVASAAAAGVLRLPGGASTLLAARNNGGTADITILKTDTSDNFFLGDATNATGVYLDAKSGGDVVIRVGGAICMDAVSGTRIGFGSGNLATTGMLNLANNRKIASRNAGNGGDITVVGTNAADNVIVGDTTNASGMLLAFKEIAAPAAPAADTFYFYIDSTTHALMVKSPGGVATQVSPA